jgi:ribosome-associated protein
LATKKRVSGEGGGASSTKKRTPKRTARKAGAGASGTAETRRPAPRKMARSTTPKPRIRASHSAVPDAAPSSPSNPRGRVVRKPISVDTGGRGQPKLKMPGTGLRKAPLAGPKRPGEPRPVRKPTEASPGPSSAARELALGLAAAAIDKKAVAIEILDVTGKVDYADFLVVMTGRSDRHVHSIATGIEEAMRHTKKLAPLSTEGLTAAIWVLIDFGDVVVHVFQEEARALYDIEGLWIDAGRVPVPAEGPESGSQARAPFDSTGQSTAD